MDYAMLLTYVLSLSVLIVRLAQDKSHFDGCGRAGYATAVFLLLCPGINTLLAMTALTSWPKKSVKEI